MNSSTSPTKDKSQRFEGAPLPKTGVGWGVPPDLAAHFTPGLAEVRQRRFRVNFILKIFKICYSKIGIRKRETHMVTCAKCLVEKVASEFSKSAPKSNGLGSYCKSCQRAYGRAYYEANREKAAAYYEANRERALSSAKAYRESNREKAAMYQKAYRKANKEKVAAQKKAYYEANKGNVLSSKKVYREANKETQKAYCRANREKRNAANAKRRSAKLGATPAWANEFFIEEAYSLAKQRTEMLGFAWHVDHIVPLQGKTVCGLHVEDNLQVIPAQENLAKLNTHWPDKP